MSNMIDPDVPPLSAEEQLEITMHLLQDWLHRGRFLTGDAPEWKELISRTRAVLWPEQQCPECKGQGFKEIPPRDNNLVRSFEFCVPCNGVGWRFVADLKQEKTADD